MARKNRHHTALTTLRWPLRLTQAGLAAERIVRAFWPVMTCVMLGLSALMLGIQDQIAIEAVWIGVVLLVLALLGFLIRGALKFRWPNRSEAIARLDETLPERPIGALLDTPAIGTDDEASLKLWQIHQARMADRAAQARAPKPDLSVTRADPFALRYVAMLALAIAVLFGSIWKVGSVAEMTPGAASAAAGPSWEGWVEPPRLTGLPTIYLNDITADGLTAPAGSQVTLRFYGQVGDLVLAETVSGRTGVVPSASDPHQEFAIAESGHIRIDGTGGRAWEVQATPDTIPQISIAGPAEAKPGGVMALTFAAQDDYAVTGGEVRVELDLNAVDRRHGLRIDPELRDPIVVGLPLPISGNRDSFVEEVIEDFSQHPWANLPVIFTLSATDAAGQTGMSEAVGSILPARHFFDPLAAAIAEQRRDLLWSRDNAGRVAQVLRAVSHRPDRIIKSHTVYLRLRTILRRLESFTAYGMTTTQQEEIAQAMWDLAVRLEDGDAADALERMRQAQERLSQAMKNGASDAEIAELMQELRDATQDYLRQLSRQAQQQNQDGQSPGQQPDENALQMTQDDLQQMMDRIQELMEQGRMAEAEQALQELQELMENMRVTQGQGQDGQSPGQQAMEGLADTLREQQGLSDQAFRDLQEQFNPDARSGESQGNEGRNGGLGRGESHEGQGQGRGEGSANENGSSGSEPGAEGEGSTGPGSEQGLADRQQALRQELQRQENGLPGAGTPEGEDARDALGRAGEAMDKAEDALRQDNLADAIDQQAQAMEALREGMRSLGEAMANEQQPGQGARDGAQQAQNRDPLGRNSSSRGGALNGEDNMLRGADVYRRARDLLEEIRRRSGDSSRSETERSYLQRLLDRF